MFQHLPLFRCKYFMNRIFLSLIFIFPLVAQSQVADSAKRMIRLQGALNFRDLGGYPTKDGKQVKWGKIYRSAEINNLTNSDVNTLDNLAINYVMDFRGPAEVAAAPDKIPAHAVRVSLPYGSENVGDKMKMMKMMSTASTGDSIMLPFYTNIESFAKRYKPVFEVLLKNSNDSAILFHCTAGKDRTGIGAALILYALGVDEKNIMNDFLASNYYRKPDNERMRGMLVNTYHMNPAVVEDVLGVKEKYLQASFETIRSKYGSIDNYLEKEMGLNKKNIKTLRQKYLN